MKQGDVIKQNLWPTNFKKRTDQEYQELLDKEVSRLDKHKQNLEHLLELAKLASDRGNHHSACILATTDKLSILSHGLDNTGKDDHSLSHAVMEALSNHAKKLLLLEQTPKKSDASDSELAGLGKKPAPDDLHDDYIGKKPGLKQFTTSINSPTLLSEAKVSTLDDGQSDSQPKEAPSGASYLASGLTAYTYQEPCRPSSYLGIMCSMALLHSRISTLIYLHPHPAGWGGANCKLPVHNIERLNHHFNVFQASLVPHPTVLQANPPIQPITSSQMLHEPQNKQPSSS